MNQVTQEKTNETSNNGNDFATQPLDHERNYSIVLNLRQIKIIQNALQQLFQNNDVVELRLSLLDQIHDTSS